MLQKITVHCKFQGEQKANYNWGSLMHGVLVQALPPGIADLLHQVQLRPFSQYVLPHQDRELIWVIGLWEPEVAQYITQAVMALTRIELQQKGLTLEVTGVQSESQSDHEYFSRFFVSEKPCRRYEIEFLTPCTHKRDGSYTLFPSTDLIFNSINMRYSAFSDKIAINDPVALEQIAQYTKIVRYYLHSRVYYLERTKITGYMGRVTLVIGGPDQLARLAGAMLSFGEYCGIGIKTALGMGAVRVTPVQR